MNRSKATLTSLLLATLALTGGAAALKAESPVSVHGSVQADLLFPEEDYAIGTEHYKSKVLGNGYASAALFHKYVEAGLRVEYMQYPLPGFEPDFKGWGIPNFFAKGKYKGLELTAGDFYEQFGSGFILRTYENRSLGVDNSLRGGRLRVNSLPGLNFTALAGVQRRFWEWDTRSRVYGADLELELQQFIAPLQRADIVWTVAGSWVMKHELDEEIQVARQAPEGVTPPYMLYRLNLPRFVNAFDVRTQFYRNGLSLNLEVAWKNPDPSLDNNYTYRPGSAVMLTGTYSRKGLSAQLQVKRSENMSFRSRRSMALSSAFLNNMPAFAMQHTYSLAAMYPYATQAAPGEWAVQADFAYTFARHSALGGRYGTKLALNFSHIRGLERSQPWATGQTALYGTDGPATKWFGHGPLYYSDLNVQLDKKLSKAVSLNAMYMYQRFNKTVIEGEGGMVNSHIAVAEVKYRITPSHYLRGELQYLATRQDRRDWLFGLLEFSLQPYLMVSVSDQWNSGGTGTHYYMVNVTGTYRSNRLMVGYGRTRAGYNCSGGVCRYVPASRGFQISYNYNF